MNVQWNQLIVILILVASVKCADKKKNNPYFETFVVYPNPLMLDDHTKNAVASDTYKWPNNTIPYIFDASYSSKNKKSVLNGMQIIEDQTCIKFVTKDVHDDSHSIKFVKSKNGCGTSVGYHSNAKKDPQIVAYSTECLSLIGAIQHELLHVIGLFHEQCRYDRDEYLDIFWENIEESQTYNFVKVSKKYTTTFGLPYDFNSLMHYPKTAYSKDGKKFTMLAKNDSDLELGQVNPTHPTWFDLEKVRRMYKCSPTISTTK